MFQPVWEQQRALACPGCNAWVFNSLVSPDGKGTAEWHRDDTFSEKRAQRCMCLVRCNLNAVVAVGHC